LDEAVAALMKSVEIEPQNEELQELLAKAMANSDTSKTCVCLSPSST